jgi:hypothetical protein
MGRLTTLQESQATGYPNDLPELNYDFQAPLGEYGQVREAYRKTKLLHLFLNAFGADLAQMVAVGPNHVPKDPSDMSVPRMAVRSRGESGFIFVNNYVRQFPTPERAGFQVQLKLPGKQISVPSAPLTLPANSYFCWPVNLQMDSVRLQYSTAQLLSKLDTQNEEVFVFFAIPGIPVDFSFETGGISSVHASGQNVSRTASSVRVEHVQPGADTAIEVVTEERKRIRIIVLTEAEAESATVFHMKDGDHMLLSSSAIFLDGNELHLRSTGRENLRFKVFPALSADAPTYANMTVETRGSWTNFSFDRPEASISWTWKKAKDAQAVGPVKMGPFVKWRDGSVAQAPEEKAFDAAAEWQLNLAQPLPAGVSDLWLNVDYEGDIGRLYVGKSLVDDDFFHGATWEIGLKRFLPDAVKSGVRIKILPLRQDAPIYLDARVRSKLPTHREIAVMNNLTLKPEYEIVVMLQDKSPVRRGCDSAARPAPEL